MRIRLLTPKTERNLYSEGPAKGFCGDVQPATLLVVEDDGTEHEFFVPTVPSKDGQRAVLVDSLNILRD